MRVEDWLTRALRELTATGISTARLDALILLEDVTGRDRSWLLAHPEHELSAAQTQKLTKLLNRRARHEPLAYIRGRTEFYGRTFLLTPAVLEPRPESETMIDLLKEIVLPAAKPESGRRKSLFDGGFYQAGGAKIRIADVGAGSGALGITAKLELSESQVELLEIDPSALQAAQVNVDLFTLSINVVKSDLLAKSRQNYDILLCNLPYVPDNFQINPAAMREPRIAIFGGPDGLDVYRQLFKQVQNLTAKPLYILTESLPPQHQSLQAIAAVADYQLKHAEDFIEVFKRGNVNA